MLTHSRSVCVLVLFMSAPVGAQEQALHRLTSSIATLDVYDDVIEAVPNNTFVKSVRVGELVQIQTLETEVHSRTDINASAVRDLPFKHGIQSLGILANRNASRIDSVRVAIPQSLLSQVNLDRKHVKVFLLVRRSENQPLDSADGIRLNVTISVTFNQGGTGHATAGKNDPEVWRYKDGKFHLEKATSKWTVVLL